MKLALENPKNKYFHLISGQDWPMKAPQKIYDFFEDTNKIYMNYWRALDMKKQVSLKFGGLNIILIMIKLIEELPLVKYIIDFYYLFKQLGVLTSLKSMV